MVDKLATTRDALGDATSRALQMRAQLDSEAAVLRELNAKYVTVPPHSPLPPFFFSRHFMTEYLTNIINILLGIKS